MFIHTHVLLNIPTVLLEPRLGYGFDSSASPSSQITVLSSTESDTRAPHNRSITTDPGESPCFSSLFRSRSVPQTFKPSNDTENTVKYCSVIHTHSKKYKQYAIKFHVFRNRTTERGPSRFIWPGPSRTSGAHCSCRGAHNCVRNNVHFHYHYFLEFKGLWYSKVVEAIRKFLHAYSICSLPPLYLQKEGVKPN